MGLNVLVSLDQTEQKSRSRNLSPNISGEARAERHIARQKKYIFARKLYGHYEA